MAASYVFEASSSYLAFVFRQVWKKRRSNMHISLDELVRADGLGVWPASIEQMTSMPIVSFMPPEYTSVVEWFTRKRTRPEDDWCRASLSGAREILAELGIDVGKNSKRTYGISSAC